MDNDSLCGTYRWLVVGVLGGVILAEVLSRRMPSLLAWLIGGSLIGLVPVGRSRERTLARLGAVSLATAVAAASAHWLVEKVLP